MYPYYKKDIESGAITRTAAPELLDCIWVKLNDLNKKSVMLLPQKASQATVCSRT